MSFPAKQTEEGVVLLEFLLGQFELKYALEDLVTKVANQLGVPVDFLQLFDRVSVLDMFDGSG